MYLPPADALLLLRELFDVSIHEILGGSRLTETEYRAAAEKNLTGAIRASSFSTRDRMVFYRRKWLKDHRAEIILLGICIAAVFTAGFLFGSFLVTTAAPLLLTAAHIWRYNAMMSYNERNSFDSPGH